MEEKEGEKRRSSGDTRRSVICVCFQGSGLVVSGFGGRGWGELWFGGLGAGGCEYWELEKVIGPAKWMVSLGGCRPHSYQHGGGGGDRLLVRILET